MNAVTESPELGPLSKQRLKLWLKLLRSTRRVEARLRDFLREDYATTLPRFDVLAALYRAGDDGLTMGELSRRLLVSNGNVTGIVERLVADGQVLRSRESGDRRATRARLSGDGRTAFAAMAAHHEALIDQLFAELSASEMTELVASIDKLGLPPQATTEVQDAIATAAD